MKIYITGYGLISSIGQSAEESIASLKNHSTGIDDARLETMKGYKVGAIHFTNEELRTKFDIKTDSSRTALLGMIAAKQAFKGHSIRTDIKTGLISGTSVGGMDVSEKEYQNYLNEENHNPDNYKHHSSGTSSEQIAKELGVDGFINTISTACSSAANALMMGARMIQNGMLDRVIVGCTDALTKFTISGFKSLMIFDDEWCRPFDESRKGLNLGEGAGFVVLESEQSLEKSKKTPIAMIKLNLKQYTNQCNNHLKF